MIKTTACCLALLFVAVSARVENVTIRGTVICNKKRLPDVEVKLMEADSLTPDDTLDTQKSDRDGEFKVYGSQDEVLGIEPYIVFVHNCNVKKPGCVKVTRFEVPKHYIGTVYDMTYVTLDIKQYGDKEKC